MGLKAHWEEIYNTKTDREVSWFQEVPQTSLRLIEQLELDQSDAIIDIGGGNSNLSTVLFEKGFTDLTVLDISVTSIAKMKQKLGVNAENIHWVESDILEFKPKKTYTLWHDRAAFHFLTNNVDKVAYKENLIQALDTNGYFILSTFSTEGPKRCSGLDICQYDIDLLSELFNDSFQLIEKLEENHTTPSGACQNFIFSVWKPR